MNVAGRLLQLAGLLLTGWAALSAFWSDVSEGFFIAVGFGGFAVFWLGTLLLRRAT